jgi:hypothetical protein
MKWLTVLSVLLVACGPRLSKKNGGTGGEPDSGIPGADAGLDAAGGADGGQDSGGEYNADADDGPDGSSSDDVGPSNAVPSASMVAITPAAPERPGEELTLGPA